MGHSAIILYYINNLRYQLISIKFLEERHALICGVWHIFILHLKFLAGNKKSSSIHFRQLGSERSIQILPQESGVISGYHGDQHVQRQAVTDDIKKLSF